MLYKKRLFPYFLGGILVILPIMTRVSGFNPDMVHGKNHFFVSVAILSVILFGFFRTVPFILSLTLAGLFVHAYLVQFDYLNPIVLYQFICMGAGMLLLCQVSSNFTKKDNKIIFNFLATGAIIQSLWVIGEYSFQIVYSDLLNLFGGNYKTIFLGTGYAVENGARLPVGTLANSNYTGAYLAVSSLALFRRKWMFFIPLPAFAFYALGATLPILTIIFGLLIHLLIRADIKLRNIVLVLFLIVSTLIVIALNSDQASFLGGSGRFKAWRCTIENLFVQKVRVFEREDKKDAVSVGVGGHYLKGHGLGYFSAMSTLFIDEQDYTKNKRWRQVHNEYLEFVYSFGIFSVFYLVLLFLPVIFVDRSESLLFGMLGAFLFNSAGHFAMHISSTAFIGIIILGLIYNQNRSSNEIYNNFNSSSVVL